MSFSKMHKKTPATPFTAKVEEKIIHNERFVQYSFELIEPHRLAFVAGQYTSIQVSEEGERRSYSFCSDPSIDHGFELLIDLQPGGLGSSYFQSLQLGQTVRGIGPMGIFTLDSSTNEEAIVLVATGSGIAPIRSMLYQLLVNDQDKRKITLYWGMRYAKDLFWLDDFEIWADDFDNFQFYPVLSRPIPEWTLSSGQVTDLITAHQFGPNTGFYLCGNLAMIADVSQILVAKQVDKKYIHHEKFY